MNQFWTVRQNDKNTTHATHLHSIDMHEAAGRPCFTDVLQQRGRYIPLCLVQVALPKRFPGPLLSATRMTLGGKNLGTRNLCAKNTNSQVAAAVVARLVTRQCGYRSCRPPQCNSTTDAVLTSRVVAWAPQLLAGLLYPYLPSN